MTNKKIGFYSFGEIAQCYGLALCLHKNGIAAERVTATTARYYDVVLVSVFWWQHVAEFFDFVHKAKVGKAYPSKTRLIVGGFNSFNPEIFSKHAHAVVVGDGEDALVDAINGGGDNPSVYLGGHRSVEWANADISQNRFIYSNESDISRIEIARGCRYRCKFCQLAAIKKYREVDTECVLASIDNTHSKKMSIFAPNKTSHSGWETIKKHIVDSGKSDTCPDVRFDHVEKFYHATSMQIGVEGISERLRKIVYKNFTDDRFTQIITDIVGRGVHKSPHLFCGYILGLPEETEDDWKAFSAFLDRVATMPGASNFTMFFVFNMFMPMPFTEYELASIDPTVDYQQKIKAALYDRKFKICVRGRLFSNYSRVQSMVCTRLGVECESVLSAMERDVKGLAGQQKANTAIMSLRRLGYDDILTTPKRKPWEVVKIAKEKQL